MTKWLRVGPGTVRCDKATDEEVQCQRLATWWRIEVPTLDDPTPTGQITANSCDEHLPDDGLERSEIRKRR